ncbi:hypothetical protein [Streptomyces lanatus]|uniref:Uncharacterized protein n=1 Tax=Streptomyces lanatus TaxID=66900 RepID=A0ABV1XHV9_9ACTN|nr:hypothetical protein [Streptomyces lanatus]
MNRCIKQVLSATFLSVILTLPAISAAQASDAAPQTTAGAVSSEVITATTQDNWAWD